LTLGKYSLGGNSRGGCAELGGKSTSIVFPDANEEWVVDGIIAAMRFTRQSQSCTAGSRLFLHRDMFDKFLGALGRKVKALKLGDPLDEADAIRMANDSHYGLAAYVWSHDIGRALRAAHAIEAGWVQVNQGLGQSPGHSYGGYKESGIGREFSLEGMLESYTQRKNVTVNLTH
jgi:acyl-CoA reductase-like NAD-dependent aldehyde dehydrogenase